MTEGVLDERRYPQVAGELFRAVQEQGVFEDAKTFVDATPVTSSETALERFLARRDRSEFDLAAFVDEQFRVPAVDAPTADHPEATSMDAHIDGLWPLLTRSFDADQPTDATLLSLPNPHVVPGGRFREMYYWDSYFVAEGLAAAGRLDTVADIAENVASLVERFGFVPLGNRVYYGSRSQPPLFYRLLRILERERGFDAVERFLPHLEREYEFWMDGADAPGGSGIAATSATNLDLPRDDEHSHRRVVHLGDGVVANRYWDDQAKPRPESYRHDRELAGGLPADDRTTLYRDVRAACESGWDFSSRWLADASDPASIRTTELIPVDLNAVLYGVESALAEWFAAADDAQRAARYEAAAANRRNVVEQYCWDADREFYVDYCWTEDTTSERRTLAGVVPLFTGVASPERAALVAATLREEFLETGGLVTTLRTTGEQWDEPNGWAPLQWMAVVGLRRYGFDDLAETVTERWVGTVQSVFERTGGMAEKYDVQAGAAASDCGEYAPQYGFGWTNGVTLALQSLSADNVQHVDSVGTTPASADAEDSVQIR